MNDKEYAKEAKAYLQQAFKLGKRIRTEQEKIDHLRSKIEYKSPSFEGGGGTNPSGSDKMAAVVAEIVEYEQEKAQMMLNYIHKYKEIEQTIREIEDDVEREILERRYLLCEPWEGGYDKQSGKYIEGIAEKVGYSVRNVYKKHGLALIKIKIPENVQ